MAKHLTPIVGLAVVVALALAAVFGSMSPANPAQAQMALPGAVAQGGVTSVIVMWGPQEDLVEGDVEVRWREPGESWGQNSYQTSGNTNVIVTVGDGTVPHQVSVGGLVDGRTYEVQVRTNVDGEDYQSGLLTVKPGPLPAGTQELTVKAVQGGVELTYGFDDSGNTGEEETGWQYRMRASCVNNTVATTDNDCDDVVADPVDPAVQPENDVEAGDWSAWMIIAGGKDSSPYTVKMLMAGKAYDFEVRAVADDSPHAAAATNFSPADPADGAVPLAAPAVPVPPSLDPGSTGSGSSTSYAVEFQIRDYGKDPEPVTVNTRHSDLVIEFNEDYTIPGTIENTSVAITSTVNGGAEAAGDDRTKDSVTFTPEDVTVDGSEIFISLGDMDERDDKFDYVLVDGELLNVLFRQSAGISNPTGADGYDAIVKISFGDVEIDNEDGDYGMLAHTIPHSISIDPEDGGLGEVVTVKGKGFKNGTSMTFFRDADNDQTLTAADAVLCTDPMVEGNIGTCDFEVSHPTFTAGATNIINGVDGVNATASKSKAKTFELKASITTSPDGGSPGEMILVQVVDFNGSLVSRVTIGGQNYCGGVNPAGVTLACSGAIDSAGSGNFSIEIPNWARGGLQELKVWSNGSPATSASTKIALVGPQIRMTSETVIANQRVSLIGTGFSPGASIANVDDRPAHHIEPMISIGGDKIVETRINDGDPVRVDNGGNWSASVDLPLSEATTAAGKREIRVRDSLARTGTIEVTIPDREVTVTPDSGRVGTIALIEGTGFPSKNDEGSNFNVEIEYEAANGNTVTISALTDASGRFEQQMRIPTTAAIPSSNQIHVRFEDDNDVTVPITVPHNVPEGVIMPSETSGGPGSTITIEGEGFKSFVPVSLVKVGTLDVTPAPKPATDGNGMMMFDIIIPGLDVGIQTIEVNVGRTTASVGFTVTESGVNPGDIKPVAQAIEELGDNLVSVWNFNNDTKVWAFYDPTLAEGNTLTHMITGETYLIRVQSDQEVILNRDTRNLTCVGSNCWNQLVW